MFNINKQYYFNIVKFMDDESIPEDFDFEEYRSLDGAPVFFETDDDGTIIGFLEINLLEVMVVKPEWCDEF